MNPWLILAVIAAAFVLIVLAKPTKTLVGGIFQRDRKGRLVIVLTPTRRKRRWK